MFKGNRGYNSYRIRYIREIIIVAAIILMISFAVHALSALAQSKETVQMKKSGVPLLLNSELVEADKAELSLTLWFEDREIPESIRATRPIPEWTWIYKESQMNSEKVSATLTGQHLVNKSEESNLFAWYTTMVPQIEKAGGRIYLDERIPQTIDIAAYLSHINAIPKQWLLLGTMISTAAHQDKIDTSVLAGQDQINIQLLSRGKSSEGQSVLAIPALLEEF
ncbi:hypothetical protein [Desulfosporosinus youngiae]|uniref:Uncharacterized protein n=1 Tax=Desulfosporosinus youngiae DSM 17734 TaxID=768710 RepID=H5Y0K2_9FIRM|nr:hypothetical protein [Desulfosporosinus youngiae]EHQ92258.1 hypothetical protein DesyoDRAFT_5330 [Desulfosporosinus youngiae DSM 17734]